MVNDPITQLVNGLESVAVVRLCVKSVLHVHLFQVAATIGNLTGQGVGVKHALRGVVLNCRPGIAAALRKLRGQVASMLCALIAKSADSVVDATEVIIKGVVQRGEAVSKAIGLLVNLADKGLLVNSGSNVGLCSTRRRSTSTITAAKSITAPAEQEQNDNPILLS